MMKYLLLLLVITVLLSSVTFADICITKRVCEKVSYVKPHCYNNRVCYKVPTTIKIGGRTYKYNKNVCHTERVCKDKIYHNVVCKDVKTCTPPSNENCKFANMKWSSNVCFDSSRNKFWYDTLSAYEADIGVEILTLPSVDHVVFENMWRGDGGIDTSFPFQWNYSGYWMPTYNNIIKAYCYLGDTKIGQDYFSILTSPVSFEGYWGGTIRYLSMVVGNGTLDVHFSKSQPPSNLPSEMNCRFVITSEKILKYETDYNESECNSFNESQSFDVVTSPFVDNVTSGHCYKYEYQVTTDTGFTRIYENFVVTKAV